MEERGDVFETPADAPVYPLDEAFWRNAQLMLPSGGGKASIHLRVDRSVLDWFKAQGKGHLTRMNKVLRAYYETHRDKSGKAAQPGRKRSTRP
jgi:hypothetical protein